MTCAARLITGALMTAVALASGCAANRPSLPPRIIDDPVTVPRGLFWVSGSAQLNSFSHASLGRSYNHAEGAEMRLGLGTRLELVNVLGLRLAVLDDSPARPSPDTLTVAVLAGLGDLGLSDDFVQGARLKPAVRIDAGKRVATRLRLGAHLAQRTYVRDSYSIQQPTLASGDVEGLYQITEVLAARVNLHAYRWHATPRIWRPAVQGGFGPGLRLQARPRRWLTVGASANVVLAWAAPETPAPDPDRSVDRAQVVYAEPRLRILILGAQAILHN